MLPVCVESHDKHALIARATNMQSNKSATQQCVDCRAAPALGGREVCAHCLEIRRNEDDASAANADATTTNGLHGAESSGNKSATMDDGAMKTLTSAACKFVLENDQNNARESNRSL